MHAIRFLTAAVLAGLAAAPAGAQGAATSDNDYPTDARAEYVFACMAVNGQNQEVLRRCACSIDVVASILTYDAYVGAETVIRMRQTSGERIGMMRTAPMANALVQELRRAQAEGEVRCF